MTGIGPLLSELHDVENALAHAYRRVAERQATDHGTYYTCHTLATQCDAHAERVRVIAEHYGQDLSEPRRSELLAAARDAVFHKASKFLSTRTETGILLLRDLRQLYLTAEDVNLHWTVLGQVARAVRDEELLEEVSVLHGQTLTQVKWLKTRLKEAAPQVLAVAGRASGNGPRPA
ncbi:hypothetical protein [Streptomyces sp. 8N616]|uniref:hypothetical protein n=1 Tax=Streptomyces sp. 8N616 TaxID=3457414 RepID=UPI003FD17A45